MLNNYKENPRDGVVYQIVRKPFIYNKEYIDVRYNTYGVLGQYMSYLRLGFITQHIGRPIKSILDIGYGNGSFLRACSEAGIETFGTDISEYPVPEGSTFVDNMCGEYTIATFFDSLEHLDNIDIVENMKAKYIAISVPCCHYPNDDTWMKNWKHLRPDEHLHHFNRESLNMFMYNMGYQLIIYSNMEDIIRKPSNNETNILSGIFKKRN